MLRDQVALNNLSGLMTWDFLWNTRKMFTRIRLGKGSFLMLLLQLVNADTGSFQSGALLQNSISPWMFRITNTRQELRNSLFHSIITRMNDMCIANNKLLTFIYSVCFPHFQQGFNDIYELFRWFIKWHIKMKLYLKTRSQLSTNEWRI